MDINVNYFFPDCVNAEIALLINWSSIPAASKHDARSPAYILPAKSGVKSVSSVQRQA